MKAVLRAALGIFIVVYFAVWLSLGIGWRWPEICPESMLFFTRSECLFPHAAQNAIDYYAEGWDCKQGRWVELDFHPYFPLVISGRETRFERIVHLFRHNQRVLEDLRAFLIVHWNVDHPQQPIADVRMLSIRPPLPPPGGEIRRYERPVLASVPPRQHKLWSSFTPLPLRDERCRAATAGQSFDPRDPDLKRPPKTGRPRPTPAQEHNPAPSDNTDKNESGGDS